MKKTFETSAAETAAAVAAAAVPPVEAALPKVEGKDAAFDVWLERAAAAGIDEGLVAGAVIYSRWDRDPAALISAETFNAAIATVANLTGS